MRPGVNEVLHFSEDPTIEEFVPQRSATQKIDTVHVWAVDQFHSPSYWFPRQCPRAMAWISPSTLAEDALRIIGPEKERVHAIEYGWLGSIQTVRLFAYRLDASDFRTVADDGHAFAYQGYAWRTQEPRYKSYFSTIFSCRSISAWSTSAAWARLSQAIGCSQSAVITLSRS